jgi:hypothetical protein
MSWSDGRLVYHDDGRVVPVNSGGKSVRQTAVAIRSEMCMAPELFVKPEQLEDDDRFADLKRMIALCEAKGLEGQLERLKYQALAYALKKTDMTLLKLGEKPDRAFNATNDDMWRLNYVSSETGTIRPLSMKTGDRGMSNLFSVHKMTEYTDFIPFDVIEKIPPSYVPKSLVFKAVYVTDPILAIPVNQNTLIGLFKWDDPMEIE